MPPVAGLPGFLRQIFQDTRALVAEIRAMGRRLSTRWHWTRVRSRQRVDNAASTLENVRRSADAKTRMCSECRALVPIGARICPECHAAPGRPVSTGAARVVENLLPGFVSANSLILTITMLIYGLTHLVYSRLSSTGDPRADYWGAALYTLGANSGNLVVGGEPWARPRHGRDHADLAGSELGSLRVRPDWGVARIHGTPRCRRGAPPRPRRRSVGSSRDVRSCGVPRTRRERHGPGSLRRGRGSGSMGRLRG